MLRGAPITSSTLAMVIVVIGSLFILACGGSQSQSEEPSDQVAARKALRQLIIESEQPEPALPAPQGGLQPRGSSAELLAPEDINPETGRPTRGTIAHEHGANFPGAELIHEKAEQNGVSVEFTAENYLGVGGRGGESAPVLMEGQVARIIFRVSDAATDVVMANLSPAAWVDRTPEDSTSGSQISGQSCEERVEGYVRGMLSARPQIDLNSYFILALNGDPSVSVIDPMINVGGMTQLFSLIPLLEPGEDWVLTSDQERLFITMPKAHKVAVISTDGFNIVKNVGAGSTPVRIALQPDERYVWVGNNSKVAEQSGVTVISPKTSEVVATIPTGAGHHEIAFSGDSRYAFVTNIDSGTLSVIDTVSLSKVRDIPTGLSPISVAYSKASQAIYVGDLARGTVTVVDSATHEIVKTLHSQPGLSDLSFSPDGRWGMVVNPMASTVLVVDASNNTIKHVLPVEGDPGQVGFSETAAFMRSIENSNMFSVQLDDLAYDGIPTVSAASVGRSVAGVPTIQSAADSFHSAPEDGAMLVASPIDDLIYYHIDGTASPAGGFQGHGLNPRAVRIIDRSLREEAPGIYAGSVRMPESGEYNVAFLLGSPDFVHCFSVSINPNPSLTKNVEGSALSFDLLGDTRLIAVKPAEEFKLQFRISDSEADTPIDNTEDIIALAQNSGGNWNRRYVAQPLGNGLYEVNISIPNTGFYNVYFASPGLGLDTQALPTVTVKVAEP